ncbi:MAG: 50S ribosomal protein L25/general stress protein Ctc [Mycobacteriales bacterium]|nr:50S ribosomal protein L25/general stress protein Ctc [Mycobacteriales bacterium]
MSEVRIAAEPRTEFGKGAARRVRRADKVPAVLYGHGDKPRHYSLPGHELMLALKHDPNALLALQTADGEQLALPKVVVRDPIKGSLEHVDLVAVRKGEKVTVEIPVHLVGEAVRDVIVDQQLQTLTLSAEATHLPTHIDVDVEGKDAGFTITAGDVALPQGAELIGDADAVVVQGLAAPTAEALEADLAASDAETGAGATDTGAEATDGDAADDAAGDAAEDSTEA